MVPTIELVDAPGPGVRQAIVEPLRRFNRQQTGGTIDRVIANGRMAMPIRSNAPDVQVTFSGGETSERRPDLPYQASLITPEWRIEEALRLRLAELGGVIDG